ncbi:jg4432 [Pararge aegeria aegeria]|uniref:Jg4432 protein n=1 Tax=Pararge aegeria aegeria TaxID=348720 RepID=A0A8S4R4X9_9NEOP|nr:jg4432 [Pararge aegeria aegeria]
MGYTTELAPLSISLGTERAVNQNSGSEYCCNNPSPSHMRHTRRLRELNGERAGSVLCATTPRTRWSILLREAFIQENFERYGAAPQLPGGRGVAAPL